MEVLEEIITWGSGLPVWQQVALLKVFQQGALSDEDIRSLAGLATEEVRDPVSLREKSGDPLVGYKHEGEEVSGSVVTLESISETKNINAIKDGTELKFSEAGLTLVYGNNGAGKSGFSRVLKAACMCRDNEGVYGDIAREAIDEPAAKISYKEDGAASSYVWNQYEKQSDALKTVHIFDSRAARVYLNEENEIKYVPAGLDIFDKLGDVFGRVRRIIAGNVESLEAAELDVQTLFSQYPKTEVYELVGQLNQAASRNRIEKLKVLTKQEAARLTLLRRIVPEKESKGPIKQQEALTIKQKRYARAYNQISRYQLKLTKETIDQLLTLRKKMFDTAKVALAAEKEKFDDGYLLGTGSSIWQQLWHAAKEYSEKTVYHDHEFPNTGEGAKCVLCQRELDENSAAKFKSFHKFMTDRSQELARQARQVFYETLEEFEVEKLLDDDQFQEVFDELKNEDYENEGALREIANALIDEHVSVYDKLGSAGEIEIKLKKYDLTSVVEFRNHVLAMKEELDKFDVAAHTKQLNEEKEELAELSARSLLNDHEKDINKQIKNFDERAVLEKVLKLTDTTQVSRQGGVLKDKYLINSLKNTFVEELKAIYDHTPVVDVKKGTTNNGITHSEIILSVATSGKRLKPEDVMSESEQKVISLAGYFAELSLSPHNSAIVLDDPVTSLDHINIEKIAKRIVDEASGRQVVVFTHNVVFAARLVEAAEQAGVNLMPQTISKMPTPGVVTDGFEWGEAMNVKARVGELRQTVQNLRGAYAKSKVAEYNTGGEIFYKRLRETWERAVEEILFAGVIRRYRRSVETQRLNQVKFIPEDDETIDKAMTHASRFIHNGPEEDPLPIPEPDKLDEDLRGLVDWLQKVKNR